MTLPKTFRWLSLCLCLLCIHQWKGYHFTEKKSSFYNKLPHENYDVISDSVVPNYIGVSRRTTDKADTKTYILPLGDSITQGSGVPGGYRGYLYEKLSKKGYDVTYLGTKKKNCFEPCTLDLKRHEGHGGKLLNFFIDNIQNWMESYLHPPDIVLLLVGTTEFADKSYDIEHAIDRWDTLIENIANLHPQAHIIASNIIDRAERFNANINKYFNPYVRDVVKKHADAGRKVSFVDFHSQITTELLEDQLHPTEEGYNIMAETWMGVIERITSPNGDFYPPNIVKVDLVSSESNEIRITFSKPLSDESVDNTEYFSISNDISIFDAVLNDDKRQITLKTSGLTSNISRYTLQVTSVTDRTAGRLPLINETFEFSIFSPKEINFQPSLAPTDTAKLPPLPTLALTSCLNQQGFFRNSNGIKRKCKHLNQPLKLFRNCGSENFPRTELGIACPESCRSYYTCDINASSPTSVPVSISLQNDEEEDLTTKCFDKDKKFRINYKHGRQDCHFVEENKDEFCKWKFVKNFCPLTCGKCVLPSPPLECQDSTEAITLPNTGRSRYCSFIKKNPKKYCNWNIFKSHCPKTCGKCIEKDEELPLSLVTCVDNPNPFYLPSLKNARYCKHIQRNSEKFCRWKTYKTNCPMTCSLCRCEDTKDKFKLNNNQSGWKTCKVVKKFPATYCKWSVPKRMCPETCNQCPMK